MSPLKVVLVRLAVAMCSASCAVSNAGDTSGVSVSVASDCANYGVADSIPLRVQIENQAPSPIVMYGKIGWGELGGLTLKIVGENGVAIQPVSLDADMIIPSTLQDRNYYVTVFKNQFIGVSRRERVSELFPSEGKYKVWVEYMSPVPKESSLVKHSFVSMESGKVISNALNLSVGKVASCKREPEKI